MGMGEIRYSLFFRIPAIVFIMILLKKDDFHPFRFRRADGAALGICLPGLCLIGVLVSLAASLTGLFPGEQVPAPAGSLSWTAAVLSSLTTGYLEEGYFRVYMPIKLRSLGPKKSFLLPVLIFSLCHAYEGPWGFANALLAGSFLAFAYIKSQAFHGIALAHGLYNVLVYLSTLLL